MNFLNLRYILIFIIFIIFIKIIIAFSVLELGWFDNIVEQGKDASTYHAHATRLITWPGDPNLWFKILRFFNDIGFYSRDFFRIFNIFLGCFLIPYLVSLNSYINNQKVLYLCFFLSSLIYSLFFYSVDIYRDPIMVFIFLIGLFFIKNLNSILGFIIVFIISWILYGFRDYLGFSFFVAFVLVYILNFDIFKYNSYFLIVFYLILLNALYLLGVFDELISYRNWFFENDANTNLKQDFYNKKLFIYNFLSSFFIQIFGTYFLNIKTIALFFLESIPVIFCLAYCVKNKQYRDKFIIFLFCFSIIYSSFLVIGNGNFGTAIRLRLFVYFCIFIAAFYIFQLKSLNKNES